MAHSDIGSSTHCSAVVAAHVCHSGLKTEVEIYGTEEIFIPRELFRKVLQRDKHLMH